MSNNYKDYLQHYGVRGMKWDKKSTTKITNVDSEYQKELNSNSQKNSYKITTTQPSSTNQSNDQTQSNVINIDAEYQKELNSNSQQNTSSSVPETFKPILKKVVVKGELGYLDKNGKFYKGTLDSVKQIKYTEFLKERSEKLKTAKDAKVKGSKKDLKHLNKPVKSIGQKVLDAGKSFISSLFD